MIKVSLEIKQEVVRKVLKGKLSKIEAARLLGCKRQTIYNYLSKTSKDGLAGLKDGRGGNNCKLTTKELSEVLQTKEKGNWRSARKPLEITNIQSITPRRVQQIS